MALRDDLAKLVQSEGEKGPFVSIFMNIHLLDVDGKKDRTTYKDLVNGARAEFDKRYPEKDWRGYQQRFERVLQEPSLGNNVAKSMAVVVGQSYTYQYYLDTTVDDNFEISDTLYILPVVKNSQYDVTYDLLKLDKKSFQLYQVVDGLIQKVALPEDAPTNAEKALGNQLTGGDEKQKADGRGEAQVFHGHNPKDDSDKGDERNYFDLVDEYIHKNYSLREHHPLILMAVSEDAGEFDKRSHNQELITDIRAEKVPAVINRKTMQDAIEGVNDQVRALGLDNLKQDMDNARSGKRYTDNLDGIVKDAIEGRISILALAEGAKVPGRITLDQDVDTTSEDAKQNNLLNDVAVTVIGFGGHVFIVDPSTMPNGAKATAALRGHQKA
ncbi:hypothetical protein [Lactobacillus selangorensis]|nr:hypothetical protein [Lactobacillus selangorensis]